MAEILLIDDDIEMAVIIKAALKPDHDLTVAHTLKTGQELILLKSFDLILLDVMFPEGNGFNFFSNLSQICAHPPAVLFLSAKGEVSDQALGFSLGAEGYILKPINNILLQARVNGILKKNKKESLGQDIFTSGDIKFVFSKQLAFICSHTRETQIDLTAREYKLLLHFCRHEEQVFSREQLLDSIWGHVNISDRTIDSHISHLRGKLKTSLFNIEAIHGVGYRFKLRPLSSSISIVDKTQ